MLIDFGAARPGAGMTVGARRLRADTLSSELPAAPPALSQPRPPRSTRWQGSSATLARGR